MPDHCGPHTPHGRECGHTSMHTPVHMHTFLHVPPAGFTYHICGPSRTYQHSDSFHVQTDFTHAFTHVSMCTCTPPCTRSLIGRRTSSCDHTLWGSSLSHLQGHGRWEDAASPAPLRTRVASWEHRLRAARASEFLREAGKLNFYVKYPDF